MLLHQPDPQLALHLVRRSTQQLSAIDSPLPRLHHPTAVVKQRRRRQRERVGLAVAHVHDAGKQSRQAHDALAVLPEPQVAAPAVVLNGQILLGLRDDAFKLRHRHLPALATAGRGAERSCAVAASSHTS